MFPYIFITMILQFLNKFIIYWLIEETNKVIQTYNADAKIYKFPI